MIVPRDAKIIFCIKNFYFDAMGIYIKYDNKYHSSICLNDSKDLHHSKEGDKNSKNA